MNEEEKRIKELEDRVFQTNQRLSAAADAIAECFLEIGRLVEENIKNGEKKDE